MLKAQEYKFVIRPEELSRMDPSRVTVHQTLGGERLGWADSFGQGLPTINISGHTGWRIKNDTGDGLDRMIKLKEQIDSWHTIRQERINAGMNPDDIKLLFVDTLDQFAVHVVPIQFVLRRSRTKPLLAQFNIAMAVISPDIDSSPFLPGAILPSMPSVISSLLGYINRITQAIRDFKGWIDDNILAPIKLYVDMTRQVLNAVVGMISSGVDVVGSIILIARNLAQGGMNIARTVAAIINLPDLISQQVNRVATEFSSIFCLISNAVGITPFYPDYSSVFGASNCSSTAGGKPPSIYADTNTFEAITEEADSTVSVSGTAQSSLSALGQTDFVLSPMSEGELVTHVNNVVNGVTVAV